MMRRRKESSLTTLPLRRMLHRWSRFRHCRGYGVHSPFAFNLITRVINERTPYYIYRQLLVKGGMERFRERLGWQVETLSVKRLLFRLVNYMQPFRLIDAGQGEAATPYLLAAKGEMTYWHASELGELFLDAGQPVDFLYLHHYRQPEFVRQVFEVCVERTTVRSLFVIQGIGYTPAMRRLWRQLRQHPRAVVTFDLYDLGLIFFDTDKQRQHYTVCF